ncbi:MAG: ferredoxin-thioredoxin reductase variable chain [Geminocystis sp.]|nr:ferredoxin-thioredoxin reductase variable chain [Geminocystis sp.]HIK36848.1 ferredoxin-thioredoxin reductase variable chain [Geminocystis sp. M7585_C2015_104]MCS7148040.1 ferredoxin-thioredoxin reductase variable chain [Geminocystis sp.]MCX8077784.1 ferredoxin-thioredoxin reductase variable chain [Geminocystis sp.]MDW8116392.1 ferredoxin-thioredoxin reductase variable chain [Geminocystis sp.]
MKVGDRVRVIKSVIVYHHPQHKNQPFDVLGMEGEIIRIVNQWQGRPISANLPYLVQFDKKFKAHFRADEIAIIDSEK